MHDSAAFVQALRTVLQELHEHPYPKIPCSPCCHQGLIHALVIRIRPTTPGLEKWDSFPNSLATHSFKQCFDAFFDQSWVQNGEPEILFTKNSRTSEISFPMTGSTRIAYDEVAAIRTTGEEIGLNLDEDHCLPIGDLPQRVWMANLGTLPMFLYSTSVFVLRRHNVIPFLKSQREEIHSRHWVPIRSLISPALTLTKRKHKRQRLLWNRSPLIDKLVEATISPVVLTSVLLTPSESSYCSSGPDCTETSNSRQKIFSRSAERLRFDSLSWQEQTKPAAEGPLYLCNLNLSCVADLLGQIDPRATRALWNWPIFSHWDMRVILWLISYRMRMREAKFEMAQNNSGVNRIKNPAARLTCPKEDASCITQSWRLHQVSPYLSNEYHLLMRKAVIYGFMVRGGAFAVLVAVFVAAATSQYYSTFFWREL